MIGPEDGEMLVPPQHASTVSRPCEDRTVHLGCRVTPALGLQSFLEESAAAARDGLFMKGGIPKGLKGARWAADFLDRYGEETVMVFPPKFVQTATRALFRSRGKRQALCDNGERCPLTSRSPTPSGRSSTPSCARTSSSSAWSARSSRARAAACTSASR